LSLSEAEKLFHVLRRLHLEVVALVPRGLLLGLEAAEEQIISRLGFLAELDEAALTITRLLSQDGLLHHRPPKIYPELSRAAWRETLVNEVAEISILQCRRDPRALAEVDQTVFAAVDAWLNQPEAGGFLSIPLEFPRAHLQIKVTLSAEQVKSALSKLTRQSIQRLLACGRPASESPLGTGWLVGRELARLPGVLDLLRQLVPQAAEVEVGQNLPRVAARLLQLWQRGELHWSPPLLSALPLPEDAAAEFVFDAEQPAQSQIARGS
jgi:hypothetical protein